MRCPSGAHRKHWPALTQCRRNFMTQKIAIVPSQSVARIIEALHAMRVGPKFEVLPGECEQRSHMPAARKRLPSRHGSKTLHTRATHQCKQQRLGLIVRLVCREQNFAVLQFATKRGIASDPCCRFQAPFIVACDVNDMDRAFDAKFAGDGLAMSRPFFRRSLQLMIDVSCAQSPCRMRLSQLCE